jgi:signal recognition particle subunit SRP19
MVDKLIYPAYLDSQKTRMEGRRVPGDIAVENPTVVEIELALNKIGYSSEIEQDKSYSRQPWVRTGRVRVKNSSDSAKNDIVQAVAAYVKAIRNEANR